jgi:trk system potassium uptake protein TrkH
LLWPQFAIIIIFLAMFFGGSTGSTAGGIKMARHMILLRNIQRIFRRLLSPGAIFPIKLNNNPISGEANHSILTFISIYILVFLIGSLMLIALGLDGQTACSSAATCMAGIGPGIGTVGPSGNFAHLPGAGKLILSVLMVLGRLEIYTVVILFTRNFWKI